MIYLYLESFRCHTETNDGGDSDEPYMIVVSVDLRAMRLAPGVPSAPASRAYVYGAFGNVDNKETHGVPFQSFWGLAGEERALPNPDDAIFLAAIMEWDDGDAHMLRGVVAAQVTAALLASINVNDRAERVRLVSQAFDSALRTPTGFLNLDDRVGGVQELRFSAADIALDVLPPSRARRSARRSERIAVLRKVPHDVLGRRRSELRCMPRLGSAPPRRLRLLPSPRSWWGGTGSMAILRQVPCHVLER